MFPLARLFSENSIVLKQFRAKNNDLLAIFSAAFWPCFVDIFFSVNNSNQHYFMEKYGYGNYQNIYDLFDKKLTFYGLGLILSAVTFLLIDWIEKTIDFP